MNICASISPPSQSPKTLYAIRWADKFFSKNKILQQYKNYLGKTFIALGLCSVSGIASTYFLYLFQDRGGFIFPGLLFTSTTIFIFLIARKKFRFDKLVVYYLLMNLTCLTLWFLTLISSYFGLLLGIISGGIGAVITFYLTNKFITKMEYNRITLFTLGGLCFLITEILQILFNSTVDKPLFEYLFKIEGSVVTMFGEVFIFWQILIGVKLFMTLQKK